jgi:glycosyltransferase involved in cell wall biosynthesis
MAKTISETMEVALPRVAYWIFNYMPKWEAASKEIALLAGAFRQELGTRIISFDQHRNGVAMQAGNSHLSIPLGMLGLPMLWWSTRAVKINHVFASAGETRLTPLLAARENTILTVAKDSIWLDRIERNATTLKSLRCVVVESERHRDLMFQLGLSRDQVRLIYPGTDCKPVHRPAGPFTILFASSPLQKYDLLSRGVHLMIAAAKQLPDVRFRLIWRKHPEAVKAVVREAGVDNVDIYTGFIADMGAHYDAAHAAILPALTEMSLKPCPHSALLALAHGKPVLASRPVSISSIIDQDQCGAVFDPTVASLCDAIDRLRTRYDHFQANAQPTIRARFSESQFVARYAALYHSLLRD